ncbi:MAG: PAS domain-containing protein, partial [Rhizobiales bacterium]|nr:PAS domain-containing protein [Hyphomicrobiales bacterium]
AVARPDVVRAINQRWLLKFWKQHLGDHSVPQWQAIEAQRLAAMSANMSFLDVIGSGDCMRFQVRFHGTTIATIWGLTDYRGRYLDEIMSPTHHAESHPPYRHAVDNGRPVYTIHDVNDRNGRLVHYERLLLPFAADGRTVDRILASFELVSEDGAFDNNGLMNIQSNPPILRLAVTIEPAAVV